MATTSTQSVIDSINRTTMRAGVQAYLGSDELDRYEMAALERVIERAKDRSILDLGVGAGRTVKALREISHQYVGVDYVQEMVDVCRRRFPGVRFEQGDARSLPQFADGSFALIVFSCNGICMVDHDGRLAILREAYRLLAPGGVFVFSTSNLNWPGRNRFALPQFAQTRNPVKLAARCVRFVAQTLYRVFNRLIYQRHEVRTADYEMLNDRCHHYRTMLYFITIEQQQRQLADAGFRTAATVFDLSGRQVNGTGTTDGTVMFVVEK